MLADSAVTYTSVLSEARFGSIPLRILTRRRYGQLLKQGTLFSRVCSAGHCRALEARVTVLETEVHRHEWQRQAADDLAVQHIMRTQALEAGARVDTLEDTGSSS
ncbi:hypothetical protein Tco_1485719 [Tanacetum coccineum]